MSAIKEVTGLEVLDSLALAQASQNVILLRLSIRWN